MSRHYVSETRAAMIVGVTPYRLRKLVRAGVIPAPLPGTTLYEAHNLEQAMRAAEGREGAAQEARP